MQVQDVMVIYDEFSDIGIKNRAITKGREIELVYEYIKYRKEQFQSTDNNKLAIFIEPQVGGAYPDIVFVEYDPENYETWNRYRDNLVKKDLKILYHIYSVRDISLEEIVLQLGIRRKDVGASIEKLYDANLIVCENGRLRLKDADKLLTNNIEAVEAKIDKWEEVLQQSIINKNFASECYALMETRNRPKKKTLSRFAGFGVGVYFKDGDKFELLKKSKVNSVPLSFNSIMINEWIGRILNKGEIFVNVAG